MDVFGWLFFSWGWKEGGGDCEELLSRTSVLHART